MNADGSDQRGSPTTRPATSSPLLARRLQDRLHQLPRRQLRDLRHERRRLRPDPAHHASPRPTSPPRGRPTAPGSPSTASGTATPRSTSMNADGSAVTRVTNDEGEDQLPVFSPDGTRIAFQSGRTATTSTSTSSTSTAAARSASPRSGSGDFAPSWSPDGRYLAFQSGRGGSTRIFVARRRRGGRHRRHQRRDGAGLRPRLAGLGPPAPAAGTAPAAAHPPPVTAPAGGCFEVAGGTAVVSAPVTAVLSTRSRLAAYVALTKPRIIELLLVTTVPTMVVAQRGMPAGWLVLATLVGGTLAAAGANATNMVIDRDIDTLMKRTQKRPLVTGEITPRNALVFAIALEVLAAAVLWLTVNPLSALLAVSATLFYVFVYSLWLKRTSTQNIVIGGAAGAVPVLVGWAAVTGTPELGPGRALRHHLRLDAAPLLGPRHPLPRRLRGGQRPHAPVGGHLRVHRPAGSSPTPSSCGPSASSSGRWARWACSTGWPPSSWAGSSPGTRWPWPAAAPTPRPCACSAGRSPTSPCCSAPWPLDQLLPR